jgi:parallel beta-helix repeat protein
MAAALGLSLGFGSVFAAAPTQAAPAPPARPGQQPTSPASPGRQPAPPAATPPAATPPPATGNVTEADGERQAALVDQEDQRIMQTRAVLAAILQVGGQAAATWKQPQIYGSAHGKTLVLPQRNDDAPYTVADLVRYGGKYFQPLRDGSFLLGVHVFVADGARLTLQSTNRPLTIRMGSVPGSFSSIVTFGGGISIIGSVQNPVRIMSWDARTRRPDSRVADGRAYIRAVGGEFRMKYAQVSDLGFWSGRTGGIALTGTDRPASATKHQNKAQRHEAKRRRLAQQKNGNKAGGGSGDVEIDPAGPEGPGGTASHVPAASLVTGSIEQSRIVGDAYGIFVSGSNQTQIVGNKVEGSLVHGVLMHRYAKNANIYNTTVTGSGGDGFVLSRATEKVRITRCVSERNTGNGYTLNGQALADGPSASGEALESFGDSSVNGSTARNNGHYGIEVLGGNRLAVQTSTVVGGDMGIVVRDRATEVQLSDNVLTKQVRQGIALRDGVTGADVAGNTVQGARTGIYLRNASGKLVGNKIEGATAHGITLKGGTGGTELTSNQLSGSGPSAVSTSDAHGSLVRDNNDTDGWRDTSSIITRVLRYAKPMNIIWACVLLIVIISMIRSRGTGMQKIRRGSHPYAMQQRLRHRPVQALRDHMRGAPPPRKPPSAPDRVTMPLPVMAPNGWVANSGIPNTAMPNGQAHGGVPNGQAHGGQVPRGAS